VRQFSERILKYLNLQDKVSDVAAEMLEYRVRMVEEMTFLI